MTPEFHLEEAKIKPAHLYLQECLEIGKQFENPPQTALELLSTKPIELDREIELENEAVKLAGKVIDSRSIAITAAYQCYSPGAPVLKNRPDQKAQATADSTLEAGHHSVRMHAHYMFRFEGVTRNCLHDDLHGTPHYNTSQRSQRYNREGTAGDFLIPSSLTVEQRELFIEAAQYANNAYDELMDLLRPAMRAEVKAALPLGWTKGEKGGELVKSRAEKLCMELARYVLPVDQRATLFYTVNETQLLRMFRYSRQMSAEGRYLVASMINELLKADPSILQDLPEPLPLDGDPIGSPEAIHQNKTDFDHEWLGDDLFHSRLVGVNDHFRQIIAAAARNTLGWSQAYNTNEEVIAYLLDPLQNQFLTDPFGSAMFDKRSQALRLLNPIFATKMSHCAHSQAQRHRTIPGTPPSILASYDGNPDYIVPRFIADRPELAIHFKTIMDNIYANVEKLIAAGVSREIALSNLPNAHAIRYFETGDLLDRFHFLKHRLCLTAQDEISQIAIEQAQQLLQFLPEAKHLFLAPCAINQRVGRRPRCPEGSRWCGLPVWGWGLDEYAAGRPY